MLAQLSPLAAPASDLLGPLGRHQVVGAVRRLLLAAATDTDILLQVDDAHLIDDADVEVLVQLATAGAPVCLLIASRPVGSTTALSRGVMRLERAGVLQSVDLLPLDDDESRRLVTRALRTPQSDAMVDDIVRAAEGNPFANIELARCASTHNKHLPGSAAQAITERLCDVPEEALAVLRWLALGGGELDMRTIEALTTLALVPSFAALDLSLIHI